MVESGFFEPLLKRYVHSPSIALCRVPELEFLSGIKLNPPVLDHCCGDGYIADMAFPGVTIDAGVDISRKRLDAARRAGKHRALELADAGVSLPFPDQEFSTVINNSGIEHIPSLDGAIAEISRVTKTGGVLHLNVLNKRYFDRWPLKAEWAESYKSFQPFHHVLDEEGWRKILTKHRFERVSFSDYFPEITSRVFAELDYRYSAFYSRRVFSFQLAFERFVPDSFLVGKWRDRFKNLPWDAEPGTGSGFLISAVKGGG